MESQSLILNEINNYSHWTSQGYVSKAEVLKDVNEHFQWYPDTFIFHGKQLKFDFFTFVLKVLSGNLGFRLQPAIVEAPDDQEKSVESEGKSVEEESGEESGEEVKNLTKRTKLIPKAKKLKNLVKRFRNPTKVPKTRSVIALRE
jgi:hypothetical protein